MYSINGIGTTIYGKRYLTKNELHSMGVDVKEGTPYIATMWFIILGIPLIPLGSYIISNEYEGEGGIFSFGGKKYYQMVKINTNWNQVFKGWAITALIISILWFLLW